MPTEIAEPARGQVSSAQRDREPGLPSTRPDRAVLDADALGDREDERPGHLGRRRDPATVSPRLLSPSAPRGDRRSRPELAVPQRRMPRSRRQSWSTTVLVGPLQTIRLEPRQTLEDLPGQPSPLLGDDDDLVVDQHLDQQLGRNRLPVEGDLCIGSQRAPSRRSPLHSRCSRPGPRSASSPGQLLPADSKTSSGTDQPSHRYAVGLDGRVWPGGGGLLVLEGANVPRFGVDRPRPAKGRHDAPTGFRQKPGPGAPPPPRLGRPGHCVPRRVGGDARLRCPSGPGFGADPDQLARLPERSHALLIQPGRDSDHDVERRVTHVGLELDSGDATDRLSRRDPVLEPDRVRRGRLHRGKQRHLLRARRGDRSGHLAAVFRLQLPAHLPGYGGGLVRLRIHRDHRQRSR